MRQRLNGMRTLTVIAILTVVLAGCASPNDVASGSSNTTEPTTTTSTTTIPPVPTLVFTVELDGGCMMMGPNCAGYRFFSDGTVELYRTNQDTDAAEHDSTIDMSLVSAVSEELGSVDLTELRAMLPEGECRGCYDGIDTTYIYERTDGQTEFDSTKVELLSSIPLFGATETALLAAQEALAQLEIQTH
jgi:hypothetical protein